MKRLILENVVIYDIETKRVPDDVDGGWNNPEGMGFAAAVAYFYRYDRYRFYQGSAGREKLAQDLDVTTAVTFNGIRFDSKVLLGNNRYFDSIGCMTRNEFCCFENYDILVEYAFARFGILVDKPPATATDIMSILANPAIHDGTFNLNAIANATLNMGKTGSGAMAPELYKKKMFSKLFEYCLHDVRITRKIFEFILNNRFIVDGSRRVVNVPPRQFLVDITG